MPDPRIRMGVIISDGLATNQQSRHPGESRGPEVVNIPRFWLEFILHLMRGRNDSQGPILTFYELVINSKCFSSLLEIRNLQSEIRNRKIKVL